MRWVCSFCLKKHFRLHVVLSWFTKRFQMPGTFEKNLLSKLSICLCLSIIPISTRPQVASSPDGELQTASNQVARSIHSKDLIRWLIASVNCEGTSLEYILIHKGFLGLNSHAKDSFFWIIRFMELDVWRNRTRSGNHWRNGQLSCNWDDVGKVGWWSNDSYIDDLEDVGKVNDTIIPIFKFGLWMISISMWLKWILSDQNRTY